MENVRDASTLKLTAKHAQIQTLASVAQVSTILTTTIFACSAVLSTMAVNSANNIGIAFHVSVTSTILTKILTSAICAMCPYQTAPIAKIKVLAPHARNSSMSIRGCAKPAQTFLDVLLVTHQDALNALRDTT